MSHTHCEQQVKTIQVQQLFIHAEPNDTSYDDSSYSGSSFHSIHTALLLVTLDTGCEYGQSLLA